MPRAVAPTLILALVFVPALVGCTDMPKPNIDPASVIALARCPSRPNCVSSVDDPANAHHIEPIRIQGDASEAWQALIGLLQSKREFEIVASSDHYLRAVATTRILRFKDDLEFLLDTEANAIEMRSASRVGYSDLGTNRKRLESIRTGLIEAGVAVGTPDRR